MSRKLLLTSAIALVLFFIADIVLGTVNIAPKTLLDLVLGNPVNEQEAFILTTLRLPRAIMAVLTGAGLAVAGLLMQTLFRNPLSGPYVLGISSGAGLGVALLIMGATWLGVETASRSSIIVASIIGSFLTLLFIIFLSLRIKDTMGLLIVGLMVGNLSSAVVSILSYFSSSDELQRYVFWSLGSLSVHDSVDIVMVAVVFCIALLLVLSVLKPLNLLLLGERYATSLGVNMKHVQWIVIIATSLLAGSITAFAGPIAFIGLAVPHLARLILPTVNHNVLLPMSILLGAILLLICDLISQLPFSNYSLPINAVTSLIGAPIIIWLIVSKRKLQF